MPPAIAGLTPSAQVRTGISERLAWFHVRKPLSTIIGLTEWLDKSGFLKINCGVVFCGKMGGYKLTRFQQRE